MPSLRDLHCFIELPGTNKKLQEFKTCYSDGCVETFVAVPSNPQPFAVRLKSSNFIAPGLAIYVFIDGVYQCNRNRQNLKFRKPPDRKALVDFCIRQKEEKQKDGTMIARDWRFEKLNIGNANGAPNNCSPNVLENIGCIEVVVLRCAGPRSAKSAMKTPDKAEANSMNMDGANDEPEHPFGLDGHWDSFNGPQYDDREWSQPRGRPAAGHGTPVQPSASHYGPPPPLSPQSYFTKARHSHDENWHATRSGRQPTPAPSTHWHSGSGDRTRNPPLPFQYGSGPIPHRKKTGSVAAPAQSATGGNAQGFDPNMLDQLLTKAVKQGVVEVQRQGGSLFGQSMAPTQASRELPGAWPPSPFGPTIQPDHSVVGAGIPAGNNSMVTEFQDSHWGAQTGPTRAATRISWGQSAKPVAPTVIPHANGWNSSQDNLDSWDSDSTWGTKRQNGGWGGSTHQRGRSETRTVLDDTMSRAKSSTIRSARSTGWKTPKSHHSVKSRPQESAWESETDKDGWTYVDAQSDTDSSWSSNTTVRPSSSISAAAARATAPPWSDMRPQTLNAWEEAPTTHVPPPPGFDWEGAPGPYSNCEALFPKMMQRGVRTADWGEDQSRSRRASSAHINQYSWGNNNNHPKTRTSKIIGTVNDEWSDSEANGRAGCTKSNHWVEDLNDWDKHEKPNSHHASERGWGNNENDWDTSRRDLRATANGWKNDDNKDAGNEWNAFTTTTKNPEPNPWATSPQRHSKPHKSRLSKYHQNRTPSAAADATPKQHWQFPPPPSDKLHASSMVYGATLPPEPLYSISKDIAREKGIEHQVRAGKGMKYQHYVGRPEYIDPLDKPYAVFRFKYRSRAILKILLDTPILEKPVVPIDIVPPSTQTIPPATKDQLRKLPQDALIDSLLKLQTKLAEKEGREAKTEVVGMRRTKDWVERHSREASVKGKRDGERRRKCRREREMQGDEGGWGAGRWGDMKADGEGWGAGNSDGGVSVRWG